MKKIFLVLVLVFNEIVFSQPSLWPSQDGKILLEDSTLLNLVDPVIYSSFHAIGPLSYGKDGFYVLCTYGGFPYPTHNALSKHDKWGQKIIPWQLDLLFQFLIDDDGNIFGTNKTLGGNPTHFRKLNSDLVPQWGNGIQYDFGYPNYYLYNKYSDGNGGFYAHLDYVLSSSNYSSTFQHYYSDGTTQFPGMGKVLITTDSTIVPLASETFSFITQDQNKNFYLLRKTLGVDTCAVSMMDTLGNLVWQNWLTLNVPATGTIPGNLYSKVCPKIDENNVLHLIVYGLNYTNPDSQKVKYFKISQTGDLLEENTFSNSVSTKYFGVQGYYSGIFKQIPTSQGFIILKEADEYPQFPFSTRLLFHVTHEGNIIFCANDSLGNDFTNPNDILASVDSTFWIRAGNKAMRFDYNFNPILAAPVEGVGAISSSSNGSNNNGWMQSDGQGGFYLGFAESNYIFPPIYTFYVQHVSKNGLFDEVLSDKEPVNKPQTYDLLEIYPNPFNPTTKIVYENKSSGKSKITIYNTLGQKVRSWNLNKNKGEIVWNGTDANGKQVASGVYLVNLVTKNNTTTKKITLLK